MDVSSETLGPPLIVAMLCAPLVCADPDDLADLHAVTMEAVCQGWERGTVVSACGVGGLKILRSGDLAVEWPPHVRSLPAGYRRCRACHSETGRKRPRSRWLPPVEGG